MRKRLLAPLSAAVCLTVALVAGCGSASSTGASSTAAASGSSKAAQPAMNYTSPNGTEYEWQPAGIYYTANSDRILIDYCAYMLEHPLQSNGDGVIFASLDDLTRIYAPDFTVTRDGDAISATHAGVTMEVTLGSTSAKAYGGSVTLDAAPYEADSTVFVPLKSFMVSGFGKTDVSNGKFYGLGNNGDFQVSKDDVYNLKMFFRGKTVGKSYYTYWNDEIGKLEPVAVYIPTSYDPSTPNKMVVQLHGAGSTYAFADQDRVRPLMKEAEQRGYIVVWPGSYCKLCNFGASIPPAGMVPITPDTDLTNPQGHSAGKLADIALAGSNVQVCLDWVESNWNININAEYIMGISMGGCGTWAQLSLYGDRFAAGSPSGAFLEPTCFDWSTITTPVMYVGGTEDRNGYDLMVNAYDIAMSQGANIEKFVTVGGAPHGDEWTQEIPETFDFFDSHTK